MPLSTRSFVKFSPAVDRRRLAALMFTDIVGYSAIFHRNEALAMKLLGEKTNILREIFPSYGGREIKTLGDGFFIEFPSVLEAVKCAYDIQSQLYQRNLGGMVDERFQIRIGIHLCDFIATEEDAFGNDVNVSSRLEKLAPPGGICISQQVVDQVSDKIDLKFTPIKERKLKNIKKPVVSYSVDLPWLNIRDNNSIQSHLQKWLPQKITLQNSLMIASLSFLVIAGFFIWAVFLVPKGGLTNPTALLHFVASWKNLIVLNPLFAVATCGLWLFTPQDRRLIYLSTVFSIGSLSLVERVPVEVTGFSEHAMQTISLLSAGLVALPFVALEALEKSKRHVEMAANFILAGVVFTALFFVPAAKSASLSWITTAISVAATLYLAMVVLTSLRHRAGVPVHDFRRLIFGIVATAEIYMKTNPAWIDGPTAQVLDNFFPVGFPLFFAVYTIFGYASHERSNLKSLNSIQVLQKVTNIVCGADSYDEKLSNMQDIICSYLNAERSTIYLVDLKGNDPLLHAQAIYGPTNKLKEVALTVDPSHGLIGRVMKTRSPLLVDDFKKEDRITDEERAHIKSNEYRTRSCLLCPLVMGNEILGVMTFSDKRGVSPFTEEDLRLVQLIAKDVAALSLHARYQKMVDHFVSEKLNELNKSA
ncbi:GAF domain-containing protein [Bdellovibrio sp. HCB288]|uniref:GAF domain-containing protein n=1 Tax=Bdellovibrio sp. HCB288 TaxID=3394355 RepID=UPI0039B45F16